MARSREALKTYQERLNDTDCELEGMMLHNLKLMNDAKEALMLERRMLEEEEEDDEIKLSNLEHIIEELRDKERRKKELVSHCLEDAKKFSRRSTYRDYGYK
jgi:hypothetical protein